jgi:hypothetical protein
MMPVQALVLVSPFYDLERLATYHTFLGNLLTVPTFKNYEMVRDIRCPVKIIHGARD